MTKKQLLLQRGFSKHDIDTNFSDYKGRWAIDSISKEKVMAATNIYQLSPLFKKDSMEEPKMCSRYHGYNFHFFADGVSPCDVSPSEMDPYIARLCNALNSIGVKTCYSCDGWHERYAPYISRMEICMKERYSVIWFWLIAEFIFGEYWRHNRPRHHDWHNEWEPSGEEFDSLGQSLPTDRLVCTYRFREAKDVFAKQNCYASFIEAHRDEFLDLREKLITTLKKQMDNGEIKHIDTVGFMKARRYMCDVFLPLSEPLKEAFSHKYHQIYLTNNNLGREG